MEQTLYVFIGWLLGSLNPIMIEYIYVGVDKTGAVLSSSI